MAKVSFIIPCYYNAENIPVTGPALIENESLFEEGTELEYVMIDDGSKDGTFEALQNFQKKYPDKVKILKLAKNVGSHYAVLAGMKYATGDCCVILAADLQDPPELIPKMYAYWQKGFKLVIANREQRDEGIFQKLFAGVYHRMIKRFAISNIPQGGFDLMLFDQQLRKEAVEINEKNTSITYLLAWLGYDYVNIPYVRRKREIGKSRWTFRKKLKLFIDAFVSFSFFPIRLISTMGLVMGLIALVYGIVVITKSMFGSIPVEGWSSLMVVLLFVSSFQMIALGIIGEYVWRTLDESRNRPNYSVDQLIDETNE